MDISRTDTTDAVSNRRRRIITTSKRTVVAVNLGSKTGHSPYDRASFLRIRGAKLYLPLQAVSGRAFVLSLRSRFGSA